MKIAAGVVLYRRNNNALEVLLVHPSGNYNRGKPWSIPKGLPDEGESLEEAAVRETREEAGLETPGPLTPLGHIEYTKSRKHVYGFAAEAPPDANPHPASWETDEADFFPLPEARQRIHPDQRPLLDRLEELLDNSAK
jgi:predicted NUDIX family NTP pyrophosphohydrolase